MSKFTSFRFKNKETNFTGRNGYFKCVGFEVTKTTANTIMLEPITTKGQTGRAMLEIPVEDLKQLFESIEAVTTSDIQIYIKQID